MIKVSFNTLFNSLTTLQEFHKNKFKAKYRYIFEKVLIKCEEETNAFKKTFNDCALKNNGKENEDKTGFIFENTEDSESFAKEIEDLLKTEVEFNLEKIPFSEIQNIELSSNLNSVVGWLIEPPVF